MPSAYENYLARTGGTFNQEDSPYESYLSRISGTSSPYDNYLARTYGTPSLNINDMSRSVAMTGTELTEQESVGFLESLGAGLKSGISLGYWGGEPAASEAMTTGEQIARMTGELAGGILPFLGVSLLTGGVGAPVALAGKTMQKSYKALRVLGKSSKKIKDAQFQIDKIKKTSAAMFREGKPKPKFLQKTVEQEGGLRADFAEKVARLEQTVSHHQSRKLMAEKFIRDRQKEYIEDLASKGARFQASRVSRMGKTAEGLIVAKPYGSVLSNSKKYKKIIKDAAERWGYGGAAAVDRLANSALTFAAIGAVSNKPGEGLVDRALDVPKDLFAGALFGAAGIPTLAGAKFGPITEPVTLMAVGAYQDYLTGRGDPDMDIRDRVLHGLSLVGFHYVAQGLSNIGAKEKMYRALLDMNFDSPVAMDMVYGKGKKFTDSIMTLHRDTIQKQGAYYINKKNPEDVIIVSEFKGKAAAEGELQQGFITYQYLNTGKTGTFRGKTLKEARNQLTKKYNRIDFKNPDLIDDIPIEAMKSADAMMQQAEANWATTGQWKISDSHELKGREMPTYSKENAERASYYRKQLRLYTSTKDRYRDYTVRIHKESDAGTKGDLVQWVKGGKEQFVDKEGNLYPLKVDRIEGDFAYINKKRSTAPEEVFDKMLSPEKVVKKPEKGSLFTAIEEPTTLKPIPAKDLKAVNNIVEKIILGTGKPKWSKKEMQLQQNYAKQIETMIREKSQEQIKEYKIPLSEMKIVRKNVLAKKEPKWKLELEYYKGMKGQKNPDTGRAYRKTIVKPTDWGEPSELIFGKFDDAVAYAKKNWAGKIGEDNPIINEKISLLKSKIGSLETAPERQQWAIARDKLKSVLDERKFEDFEKRAVISTVWPNSKGKPENLTERQLKRVIDVVQGDENVSVDLWNTRVSLPNENFIEKISPEFGQFLKTAGRKLKETGLPTSTIAFGLGPSGAEVGKTKLNHGRFRQHTIGLAINHHGKLHRDLKGTGVDLADVSKYIIAWKDPDVFGPMQKSEGAIKLAEKLSGATLKGMEGQRIDGLKAVVDRYSDLFDEGAIAQISSNSWTRNTRTKTLKRERFLELYDTEGNYIEIVNINKDFDLHSEQVRKAMDFLKKRPIGQTAAGRSVYSIPNSKGQSVLIDPKKSRSHFVGTDEKTPGYSPRAATKDFIDFVNADDRNINMAADYLAQNDKNYKGLNLKYEEKFDLAKQFLDDLKKIHSTENIHGQQYTRSAELPAYFYVMRGRGEWGDIIPLDRGKEFTPKGEPYKVGNVIKGNDGNKWLVDKVIKVYETDYVNVVDDYFSRLAHSTATYHAYGGAKSPDVNRMINKLSENVGLETKDSYYKNWSRKVMRSQVYGEKQRMFDKVMSPITRWSAIAGLSFPISGLKNLLLGNVQNLTVFTGQELFKSYNRLINPFSKGNRISENWKTETERSAAIGAPYVGAYDLYLETKLPSKFMRKWLPNLGLMRTTEVLNRKVAQSIGPFALETHVSNLARVKKINTKGVSREASRRILMDAFEFTPDDINNMVYRYRDQKASYMKSYKNDGRNFSMKFNNKELVQARQQAHLVTQGSGDLPYVPYWMGQGWAKPLTLFYRVAYRMTENLSKYVIKPAIIEGNMVPAMKYFSGNVASGWTLYQVYDFLFDEERTNNFKSTPSRVFDYFLKAEGFALFSNGFSEYGGFAEAYKPVPIRNAIEVFNNIVDVAQGKKMGTTALDDGLKEVVAAYGGYQRVLKNLVGSTTKRVDDSKRRQYQFLDAYYPREKINLDYDDGMTAKTPYYRALKDVFWSNNDEYRARAYYSSLAFLTHRIMEEKYVSARVAQKEARTRLKNTVSKIRPIPKSWRKTRGATGKSRYNEYINKITPEQSAEEESLNILYNQKRKEFYNIIQQYRSKYYKEV